jgi:hypothetical protein
MEPEAELGMAVPTAPEPEGIPQIRPITVTPEIAPEDMGIGSGDDPTLLEDPGEIEGDEVQEVNRDESDQFSAQENAKMYDLQRQVNQLQTANALITEGRRAEQYRQYLTDQKAQGASIGDVETTVDFLMTQSPEQVAQFQKVLSSQPKIMLGGSNNGIMNYSAEPEVAIRREFESHRNEYSALGVTPQDLASAKFVRADWLSKQS